MRPARRVACAVLAVAVVTSVVYATGAFSSTTAERDANVKVAGDASAFLSLQESNGPNAALASYGDNGALQVKIGGAGSRASGVNPDSQTEFENVFLITNKGAKPVSVWFTGESDAVTFTRSNGRSIESKRGAVTLRPGGEPVHVGVRVDARGVKPGRDLLKSVTIRTDATVEGESVENANKKDKDTSVRSRTSHASTEGKGGGSNQQSGNSGDGGGGALDTVAGTAVGFAKWGYDATASVGDTAAFGLDEKAHGAVEGAKEWTGKQLRNAYNSLEAGYNDVTKWGKEKLESFGDFITKKANKLESFIEAHNSVIEKHRKELWAAAIATPGFFDDMVVWTLLHPETTVNLSLGATFGAVGLESSGDIPLEQSKSISYFTGWMAGGIVPVVDIVADVRDTVQALINGNALATGLGLASIAPGLGKAGDFGQVAVYTSKWSKMVGKFSGKLDELYGMLKSGFLSRLPSNVKGKILDALPDVVIESGMKMKKTAAEKVPDSLKRGADDTDDTSPKHVVGPSSGIPNTVRKHMDRTDNPRKVKRLLDHGVSTSHMNDYLDWGVSLDVVSGIMSGTMVDGKAYKIVKRYREIKKGAGTVAGATGKSLSLRAWWCNRQTRKERNSSAVC